MSNATRKILVTSALPYVNGLPHMGHMVEYIQTDIWVRFQKLRGHDCIYVCASDAHGTPIMLKARELGVTPEELTERVSKEFVRDFADFGDPASPRNAALVECGQHWEADAADVARDCTVEFLRVSGVMAPEFGDDYLARLYRTAAARFHFDDWDTSIQRKLGVLRSVYQNLADSAAHRRSEAVADGRLGDEDR